MLMMQETNRVTGNHYASESAVETMKTAPTVVACYSVFDSFFPACGFTDLTDGMYEGDPTRSYEAAQARQAEVLLDRARVGKSSRLLDIGCGYGRIVKAANDRGARGWGITVSPEQVRRNTKAGLNVRLQDYKHLGNEWNGQFDAVIANGSMEHFVQPADAEAGRDNDIYEHLFETVHRLLDPKQTNGRFVTTTIHFQNRPNPADWLRPPTDFAYGSTEHHWSRLAHSFGGWYPVCGQLEECAKDRFRLIDEEDGTEDYRLTSESCLSAIRQRLRSIRGLAVWLKALPVFLRRPVHSIRMLRCMLGSESWNWQFRGDPAPTILLRQTWQRV